MGVVTAEVVLADVYCVRFSSILVVEQKRSKNARSDIHGKAWQVMPVCKQALLRQAHQDHTGLT